jgi:hypothetical protein
MEGDKKRALSGAERQAKYAKANKEKVALNEAKKNFNISKLKQADPDKAKLLREAARRRKQAQRLREKEATKENVAENEDENPDILEADNTFDTEDTRGTKRRDRSLERGTDIVVLGVNNVNSPGPSRQSFEGGRQKRKNMKDKNQSIQELKKENQELINIQNRHDDELAELDIKLSETEHELIKYKDRVKELQWFIKT